MNFALISIGKKIKTIVSFSFCLSFCLQVVNAQDAQPDIFINEINNANIENDDFYIELVVLGSSASPCDQQIDFPNIIVDDNNTNALMEPGYLAIKSNCLRGATFGDIILIYGKNTNVTDKKGKYAFRIDDSCIEKWEGFPNTLNPTYENGILIQDKNAKVSDFISMKGVGDLIQIRDYSDLIQSIPLNSNKNYSVTAADFCKHENLLSSFQNANTSANGSFINVISSLDSKLGIETKVIDGQDNTSPSLDDIEVKICSGTPPFTVITEAYHMSGITSRTHVIRNLLCGDYEIVVEDSADESDNSFEKIVLSQSNIIYACPGASVTFPAIECLDIQDPCYAWFPEQIFNQLPGGNTSIQPEITISNVLGDYEFQLQVSDKNGSIVVEVTFIVMVVEDLDNDGYCGDQDPDENDACQPNGSLVFEISDVSGASLEFKCSDRSKQITVPTYESYVWNTGETLQTIDVEEGYYELTITDINGCSGTQSTYIYEYDTPSESLLEAYSLCDGSEVTLSLSDFENPGYTILWNTGQISNEITVSDPGVYTVTISNLDQCEQILSTEVKLLTSGCCDSSPPFSISYTGITEVCQASGSYTDITVDINGGSPVYELLALSPNVQEKIKINAHQYLLKLRQGTTSIIARDINGCSSNGITFDITVNPNSTDTDGDGICDELDPDPTDPCEPYADTDGDGVCDGEDCDPDDGYVAFGIECDDFNPCTRYDAYNEECNCVGEIINDCDCDVPDSPCDDGNFCTTDDVITSNCVCSGVLIIECDECEYGSPCDDDNPCTFDDFIRENCDCRGIFKEEGETCDDNDACTKDDKIQIDANGDCSCTGDLIVAGEKCDDGDDCTYKDEYVIGTLGECSCIGKNTVDFDIDAYPILQPCTFENHTLTIIDHSIIDTDLSTIERFEWYFNGTLISETKTCVVQQGGQYKAVARGENNCYQEKSIDIINYDENDIEIESFKNRICNELDPVLIWVSEVFQNPRCFDEFNNEILNNGISNEFLITKEGHYRIEVLDGSCTRSGEIQILPLFEPELEITLIDGKCGIFKLESSIVPEGAALTWITPSGTIIQNQAEIEAPVAGIYTLEVSDVYFEGCKASASYKLLDVSNADDIEDYLVENGFTSVDILSYEASLGSNSTFQRTLECPNVECFIQLAEYEKFELDGAPDVIDNYLDYIDEVMCEATSSCTIESGVIIANSFCNEGADLDYFMTDFPEVYKNSTQIFILHPDPNGDVTSASNRATKLLFKNNEESCLKWQPEPNVFKYFLLDMICDIHSHYYDSSSPSENLFKINHDPNTVGTVISSLDEDKSVNISTYNLKMFDGRTYNGVIEYSENNFAPYASERRQNYLFESLLLINYRVDEYLDLSNINDIDVSWKTDGKPYQVERCGTKRWIQDKAAILTIPYEKECNGKLELIIGLDDYKNFPKLLDPQVIQTYLDQINGTNTNPIPDYFYETFPTCLIKQQDLLCNNLNNMIPLFGQDMNSDYSPYSINHFVQSAPDAKALMECYDENDLIYRYHKSPELTERDQNMFFKHSLEQWYESDRFNPVDNSEIPGNNTTETPVERVISEFTLSGDRDTYIFGDYFKMDYRQHNIQVDKRHVSNYGYDKFEGNKTFSYTDDYMIRASKEFMFFDSDELSPFDPNTPKGQLGDLVIPGFYVPYAVYNWEQQNDVEAVFLTLEIAGFIATIYGLPVSLSSANIGTLGRALGLSELTFSGSALILQAGVCECSFLEYVKELREQNVEIDSTSVININSNAFCLAWKSLQTLGDITLLVNSLRDGGDAVEELKEAFDNLNVLQKDAIEKTIIKEVEDKGGTLDEANEIITLFRLGKASFLEELIETYGSIYNAADPRHQNLFEELASFHVLPNNDINLISLILKQDVVDKIKSVSTQVNGQTLNGIDFLERIKTSVQTTGGIHKLDNLAYNTDKITPDIIDTWANPLVAGRANLTKNFKVLNSLTKVRKNNAVSAVLQTEYGTAANDGWAELFKKLTNDPILRGCSTCGGGKPWVETILENLNEFGKFSQKDGFASVIKELGSGKTKAIGGNWVMNYANNNLTNPRFEVETAGPGRFVVDIQEFDANNVLKESIECKSWGSSYMYTSGFKAQFFDHIDLAGNDITKVLYRFQPSIPDHIRFAPLTTVNKNVSEAFRNKWKQFLEDSRVTNPAETGLHDMNVNRYMDYFRLSDTEKAQINDAVDKIEELINIVTNDKNIKKIFLGE